MNALPICYKGEYWILSNMADLQLSALEITKQKYEFKYIINEKINGSIFINNVCSLHNENLLNKKIKDVDCFYDEHLNIMFIKCQDIRIEYLDITDLEIEKMENFHFFENESFTFSWKDLSFQKKKYCISVQ
jgi:hypothetical protein